MRGLGGSSPHKRFAGERSAARNSAAGAARGSPWRCTLMQTGTRITNSAADYLSFLRPHHVRAEDEPH